MSQLTTDQPTAPVRWGILATGKIAESFATDLALVPDATLAAVGSRTLSGARDFAERHGAPRAYGSYAELAADPEVDVIYVATPHGRHVEDVLLCFEHDKPVLCEKALTLNARQAAELVAAARLHNLFFAEAMWMRCNPRIRHLLRRIGDGACGDVRQVRADLGFVLPAEASARLVDPALGASALLDVGIYPLTFAYLVLGEPADVVAAGALSDRGFDLNGGATLRYDSGAVASVSWTQTAWSDAQASVAGPDGRIEVASRMHMPPSFSYAHGWETHTYADPVIGRGYAHEIIEVGDCLRAGRTESELLPLDDTLAIMALMDRIRDQLGVRYAVD
ncbi:Gfo/Idh/MocA family protein [Solicola gregarius]|uniref:Gfo/Idh/MocA family oxidoreductase n=1 Tax=Solicola gregarius TaxID=2908642 RepID=A0AA46TK52_9ACTN|nr:Gfo/Idh/MocA family oxidoreductase [Solicola gregarius]UYM06796.1 Gfo/Idh/MocA family oxidoreductase [Solicola gregarius]